MSKLALPYVILLGVIWGTNLVAARFSLDQFDPVWFVGLRLVLASLAHLAFYVFNRRRRWPALPQLWQRAAVMGVLGTAVPMVTLVASLQYQSSGVTAIFITVAPAITVLMAHFFLPDEGLTWRKSAGIALALGGAMLLVLRGESGLPEVRQASPVGFGLVLLGMVSGSAMAIYARRQLRQFDAFDVATVRMLVATLTVIGLAAAFIRFDLSRVDSQGYLSLGYTAWVGAFAGLLLEFYIIQRFGATAAALTAYVIPIVAVLAGAAFLGEQITGVMFAGMAVIGLGIGILNK